ncbi:MAG: uroporphyrinogen decarboxylase family protein [Kiritimatiellia bacterium]|nr:uroporphyrinogen decarboxylase family protein [Kiritimatiellia bacterium]
MNSKDRCIATIKGTSVDRIPVFPLLMFFAQQRLGITYREFSTNGHALADAQLNIRDKFPVDAITACSDAFRITADLGAEMIYPEDKPPFAAYPLIKTEADFRRLSRPDPLRKGSRMADRVLGVKGMADAVGKECLVLGWVDMPFAEACSICGVTEFMLMIADNPSLTHAILRFLAAIVIDFGVAQIQVGVPMIGAGDAAASLISPDQYREFALPYEQMVVDAIHAKGGLIKLHICGNTTHLLKDMIRSGADLFNVDHLVDFQTACGLYGRDNLCFKGNLNPVVDLMQATPMECRKKCLDRLQAAAGLRYMLSPGCEVPAETADEVFHAFCEAPLPFAK